jgi:hypothetical protein
VWGHWLPGALLDIDKGTQKVFPGNVGGGDLYIPKLHVFDQSFFKKHRNFQTKMASFILI